MRKNVKKLKVYEIAGTDHADGQPKHDIKLEEYYNMSIDGNAITKNQDEFENGEPEKKMDAFYIYRKNKTLVLQTAGFFIAALVILSGIIISGNAAKKNAAATEYYSFVAAERDVNTLKTIASIPAPEHNADFDDMKYIDQHKDNMPNGCEVVSLAMVLSRYIPDITPSEIAENYLPRSRFPVYIRGVYTAEDPTYYYIGDPAGKGLGIFAPGLAKTAQDTIDAYGLKLTAFDISGCTEEELFGHISDGYPVIVWIPMKLAAVNWGSVSSWYLPDGEFFRWPNPMHCAVLADFSETTVTLYDPTVGIIDYDRELFLRKWDEIGPNPNNTCHAVVIK